MDSNVVAGDRLFLIAENLAQDFSRLPTIEADVYGGMRGLVSRSSIARKLSALDAMDIDTYIETVVEPAEKQGRPPAPSVIQALGSIIEEESDGPFYCATVAMDFDGEERLIGFIAQDRSIQNGTWMPQHHLAAVAFVEKCSKRAMPIVSLMDTPGAASDAEANRGNQAHSISRLIAEMSNVDVPNVGIIFGLGYSGGAIPLAASNIILSVRDGVFSTIQPKSLASIARRLNLSWQECAKHVGVSPYELMQQGNIDGIIDYAPGDDGHRLENLRLAIVSGILAVEQSTKTFVAENPYILDHYRRSLLRYLEPSERLQKVQASASLKLSRNPTEYLNVFGVTFRYLRYLRVRRRIKATTRQQYGRLAQSELPEGELGARSDRERRRIFLRWVQDPDKLIYDDTLNRAWKGYTEKKRAVHEERTRVQQFFLGEPRKNYEDARNHLLASVGMYLYNRWKSEASGNLRTLKQYIEDYEDTRHLIRVGEILDPVALVGAMRRDRDVGSTLRERFTHEGKKLLAMQNLSARSDSQLRSQLSTELNLAMTEGPIDRVVEATPRNDNELGRRETSYIVANRRVVQERFNDHIAPSRVEGAPFADSDRTVLDVLLESELRDDFVTEIENMLLFDSVYDQVLESLDSIAEEAERSKALAQDSVRALIERTLERAEREVRSSGVNQGITTDAALQQQLFFDWYLRVLHTPKSSDFFRAVEEWKKTAFPHVSDTLVVVVTFFFERLLVSHVQAVREGRRYDGRISPRNIGRKKDFWNRLNIAYRDLLIQNALLQFKARRGTGYKAFVEQFFDDFEEHHRDSLSTDPCQFPGLRISIESALDQDSPPCGVIAGVGTFRNENGGLRVGTVISNPAFQAGAFDMASAEKFCKLLVTCAEQNLPVVCFISSGGMQTKEGAGSLFSMAAINDRITRFVRDFDLPVIIFGHGDCTGGAQASFVTHPLVQTYYFSGTSMPFAGQIVVQSNLPSDSILSNYLVDVPGAMQGLVRHPFYEDLDDELRRIDPDIPVPSESVVEVVNRVMSGILSQERPMVTSAPMPVDTDDLYRPVKRVLIHARGCTAAKLIRVAQREAIEVVLVQSDPDMESVAVDLLGKADSVICIGGNTPDESYLNAKSVIAVAEHEHVDALHPGIGFLSESSRFAELVRSRGINFIGPPVSSMEAMGNKSNAINTALRLNVPVVPGSHGIVTDAEKAGDLAEHIGYPLLIKAVHGGGGKGIQVVEDENAFHELFQRVSVEARAAFGNGDVYLEKFVTSLRHIEAQLLRDRYGNTRVLGIRDCSVQRDKQKVIEESGSTLLPDALLDSVVKHTEAIASEVDYVGAGTVEFIYDLDADEVYFMEMNTRLQVEHPVTEYVSGVDIVAEQFRIAGGGDIADLKVGEEGYAIEARVNAERIVRLQDGTLAFRPSAGTIDVCRMPEEKDVDVITTAGEGKFVSPYYDSMLAQIVVHAKDRDTAASKLEAYLGRVEIAGICTNIPLVRAILKDPKFLKGEYDTNYLPDLLERVDADALIDEIDTASGHTGIAIGAESIRIDGSDELKVLSPTTGIFYSTPSPAEPEYIMEGDRIGLTDTLCQLEAFKIFTPMCIADFNTGDAHLYEPGCEYEVVRTNVASGQQVNVGDLLFVIRPT
ncbi:MAG TPA: ATP-grasp domain-containing protein [Gammaproteobacteria bacterium]|nr:ATP-grasp domain-containing protein [Gammaproteobacteria bacterium]